MSVRLNPHDELLAFEAEIRGIDIELSVLRSRHQADTQTIEELEAERNQLRNRMVALVEQINGDK